MNARPAAAEPWAASEAAGDLANGFARHIVEWAEHARAPADSLAVLAAAARHASLATQDGHVCARLEDLATDFPDCPSRRVVAATAQQWDGGHGSRATRPAAGSRSRRAAVPVPLLRLRTPPGRQSAPARKYVPPTPSAALFRQLERLFASPAQRPGGRPDWQKLATALAWRSKLTIISGGPGTGKTTTVVALLACLLSENPQLRIALAAPTGKAAARMLEALRRRAGDLPTELQALLPRESHTLHRLLGVTQDAGRFRHHAENPLPVDALVVDEASMLDLALACHLVDAMPPDARLILLGDKDQLAAVEAGAVFAEISADPTLSSACAAELAALTSTPLPQIRPAAPVTETPLRDCVVWLSESHRFATTSGIGRLAAEVNAGRAAEVCACLASAEDPSIDWLPDSIAEQTTRIREAILDGYRPYVEALARDHDDPAAKCREIFAAFDRFRVLCALRDTARGVDAVNKMVEQSLQALAGIPLAPVRSVWYAGRPVMVLKNDYVLRLFNGDIGICLPDAAGELLVWFPEQGSFRPIAPIRLPEHDTAFAITVHKSQGSEFESVLLLLPEKPHRVLTRELLYTGLTRASKKVGVVGSGEVLTAACANPTQRHSGLIARLRESAGS
jgi:exodeoxyribonuclease V alpha subunit